MVITGQSDYLLRVVVRVLNAYDLFLQAGDERDPPFADQTNHGSVLR